MNKWCGTIRLVRDPELKQFGEYQVAKVTGAAQRRFKTENQPDADFIPIEIWGKRAEFVSKYFTKGMKAEVTGEIQTNSYTDKDGKKCYGWCVKADDFDFAESKQNGNSSSQSQQASSSDGFMSIPSDLDSEELPFS